MEVDHDNGVTCAGIGLRIPAIVEITVPRPLRATMNQEGNRIFLRRFKVRGLECPSVDGLAVPSRKSKLFSFAEGDIVEACGVDPGDLCRCGAIRPDRVELGGGPVVVTLVEQESTGDRR